MLFLLGSGSYELIALRPLSFRLSPLFATLGSGRVDSFTTSRLSLSHSTGLIYRDTLEHSDLELCKAAPLVSWTRTVRCKARSGNGDFERSLSSLAKC